MKSGMKPRTRPDRFRAGAGVAEIVAEIRS